MQTFKLLHVSWDNLNVDLRGWEFLRDGHHPSDSKGTGGAWYFQGDRVAAMSQIAEYDRLHAERAKAYYAQPWV